MTPQSIGLDLLDIFEGVNMRRFVNLQKDLLLEYVAKNARKGLPFELEEYMLLMLMLYSFLEDLPTKKGKVVYTPPLSLLEKEKANPA